MQNEDITSHTPGPWKVGQYTNEMDDDGELVSILGVYGHDGLKVAKIETWRGKEYANEWEGNANLIAAAPDLLEIMKIVYAHVSPALQPHIYEMMRNVIAEAEGKQ